MPKITDIKKQKVRPRVNIYLDGKFGFSLNLEDYLKLGLKKDQEIDLNTIPHILNQDQQKKLFDSALNFLSFRPRSEKEIRDKLWAILKKSRISTSQESLSDKVHKLIDETVASLKKMGQVDDLQFTLWWIEQRQKFRPKGRMALANELSSKGIKKEIIDEAFSRGLEEDDLALASKLIDKKKTSFEKLADFERKKKVASYLARRGFSWEVINQVLTLIKEE